MKTRTLLGIAFVASVMGGTNARAACPPSQLEALTSPCFTTGGTNSVCCSGVSNCDTNDRTADEVRQCKLDYWRKEVDTDRKALEKAQRELDHARDRVKAFER